MGVEIGPIARPYPRHAIESAHSFIKKQGHRSGTSAGAESTNSPLWQRSIWAHLSEDERVAALKRGADLIAKYRRKEIT